MSYYTRHRARLQKANPYHDEEGKFTTADGAVNTTDLDGAGARREADRQAFENRPAAEKEWERLHWMEKLARIIDSQLPMFMRSPEPTRVN